MILTAASPWTLHNNEILTSAFLLSLGFLLLTYVILGHVPLQVGENRKQVMCTTFNQGIFCNFSDISWYLWFEFINSLRGSIQVIQRGLYLVINVTLNTKVDSLHHLYRMICWGIDYLSKYKNWMVVIVDNLKYFNLHHKIYPVN